MSGADDSLPSAAAPLRVPARVLETIDRHARAESPRECCGLLVGDDERIVDAVPAHNLAARATRYEIDPADHFRAIREARAEGLRVIGAYHSHPPPSRPEPSPADLEEAQPHFVYLIATPHADRAGCDARAYCLEQGNFRRIELVLLP